MQLDTDEYEKWGLVFVLALTLECWIEGLVVEADLRDWIFHAVAATAAGAALYRRHAATVVAAGTVSAVAFLSDLERIVSTDTPLRFALPGLLLLAGAGVVFYGFFQSSQQPSVPRSGRGLSSVKARNTANKAVDIVGAVTLNPNLREDIRESKKDPAWTPFLLLGGVVAILYCMISAKWIRVDAFFGLTSRSLDFNDLRDVYEGIGVKYFAKNFYFEWGFTLPYVAAILGLTSAIGWLTKRFEVTAPLLYVVLAVEAFALLVHSAVLLGINDAVEEPQLLSGPWLGSLGIAAVMAGTWLASSSS